MTTQECRKISSYKINSVIRNSAGHFLLKNRFTKIYYPWESRVEKSNEFENKMRTHEMENCSHTPFVFKVKVSMIS